MTSFSWKRKIGGNVSKEVIENFEKGSMSFKEQDDEAMKNDDVDWLTLAPKRQCLQLEDAIAKSARLRQEGIVLAEAERFWEAMRKWDEAIQLTSHDETLYEMKAQALLSLGEVFPALAAAEKAVALNKRWWIGHQTLGRALLGLGEVKRGLKSFCHAFHLNPANEELLNDDLNWALELVNGKIALEDQMQAAEASRPGVTIVELDSEENDLSSSTALMPCVTASCDSVQEQPIELKRLPPNYIIMRD